MAQNQLKVTVALLSLSITALWMPQQTEAYEHPAVVSAPEEGLELLWAPMNKDDLDDAALIKIKIDRISVPYASMMVATQTLAPDGIPVHFHTFEDELIYVVGGQGAAIVGDDRKEIPIEAGSVLYVPTGEWHGVRNADPDEPMDILLVTTPVKAGGLEDFFRKTGVLPGHPPLGLSEEEFLAMFSKYGMVAE